VWFSGNSAAFGYGQRDDHTIASELSDLGAAAGIDLEVRNLGQPGTAFFDELPWLESHLEVDDRKPDAVVLYDGFNDVLQCYMYAIMRNGGLLDPVTYYDQPTAVEFQKLDPPPDLDAALVPKVASHVAKEFRETQSRLNSMLGARGIPSVHFFQPDAFVSPLQAEGLAKSMNRTMAELIDRNSLAKLLAKTAEELEPDVHDLRPIVKDFDRPVFADPAHMNETGARLVAEAIFPVLEPLLST
jgi:lysophospholipase L1-like esterase